MKKKYVMIGINRAVEDGVPYIRRVLIRYKGRPTKGKFGSLYYKSTKLLAVDSYFKEVQSHTYLFDDDGYTLIDCTNPETKQQYIDKGILGVKRQYHTCQLEDTIWFKGNDSPMPTRFKAKNDEEAIKLFNEREDFR